MTTQSGSFTMRRFTCWVAALALTAVWTPTAKAAFHLWDLAEIYSNSSGTLQFIELSTPFGSQEFVAGQTINVSNIGASLTNMLTLPSNLPGDSTNKRFLIGTAGVQAAGAPAPDFIMPNGFLFTAGGTINFFGANSGPYTAMPTDGTLSRVWGGGNQVNSPTNFAGQSGQVVVPEPTTMVLAPLAIGMYGVYRRMTRRRKDSATAAT